MRVDLLCAISSALLAAGCGKSPNPSGPGGPPPGDGPIPGDGPMLSDGPGHNPGTPGVGAHGLAYYKLADPRYPSNATSISTPKLTTSATGSTIVVSVGRGDATKFAAAGALPTDTAGNVPYLQQGPHPYTNFQESGTALYTFTNARGGPGFQVTTSTGQNSKGQLDEITIAAVEVVEGIRIQDQVWNEVLQNTNNPVPITSHSVTTTGPATLVAFWWGDGFPGTPQSATPDPKSGFDLIDTNAQETDSFVQCAVAVRNVSAAGTYSITWTSDPLQGAQLWLVAVQ